jgi:hypothetical protein
MYLPINCFSPVLTAMIRRTVGGAVGFEERRKGEPFRLVYADGGYVTEKTLSEAEQSGMELLGPTRPDPYKGPYNADAFQVDIDKRQAICPQGKTSTQWSHIQDASMGTEYYRIEWASQCNRCPARGRLLQIHASEKQRVSTGAWA